MKTFFKISMVSALQLVLLAGCAAGGGEARLLQTTKAEAAKQCSQLGDLEKGEPNARKNALAFHHCLAEVADKTLIPYSAFPDIWLEGRAKGFRLAKQYQNGQIDYTEYKAGLAEGNAEGMRKMQARMQQMQQQQMQASKDLQALGSQMILQDQMINRANTPKTINCVETFNGFSCSQF